jgi:type 2 lantibiotic biosynthesis protein LanM
MCGFSGRRILFCAQPELSSNAMQSALAASSTNTLTPAELVSIIERSASIYERRSVRFQPIDSPESIQARARRLEDWQKIVAGGDPVRFERRLAWDDLTLEDALIMVGEVRMVAPGKTPAWALLLSEITAEVRPGAEGSHRCFTPTDPVPFEDILAALVAAASNRLAARVGSALDRFSGAARGGLERALLRRLHIFFGDTLYLEYAVFRSQRLSGLDLAWMRAHGDTGTGIYQAFVDDLLNGGLRRLWLEYPALARLVATAIESWVDATGDLVERLAADAPAISSWLPIGVSFEVCAVEGLLSDSHNRGRSVSILTLSQGVRVVYKPRSVANEAAWFGLIDWLNRRQAPQPLPTLGVLDRSSYGWMEFVAAAPLADRAAAERYYFRCGMLVALSYVVGVNDLHFENLIAAGDQPVLVDLETILCHSPVETISGSATDDILRTVFFESPLRTGLLPRWQTGQGTAVDVSGLGAVEMQRSRVPVPQWKNINSDLMTLDYQVVEGAGVTNVAILDGKTLSPNDYLDRITRGFQAMYRSLVANREGLLGSGGPLGPMSGLKVRFIFRATALYLMTMKGSRRPHLLRNGADRSIHLEPIAAPLVASAKKPAGWPLVAWERLAMEIEDCPYFVAPVTSTLIEGPPGGIDGLLEAPCYRQMVERLRRLDEEDLDNQLALVRASFDSRIAIAMHGGPRAASESGPELSDATTLTPSGFLEEAVRIGEMILSKSVTAKGRAPHWVTLRHLPGPDKNQLDPISPDLFEGRAGIALVMALLGRISGTAKFTEAAQLLVRAMAAEIEALDPRYMPEDTLVHGLTGVASLVYAFACLAESLGMPECLDVARRAARFLTEEAIAADTRFDILSGAAGSILSLIRLGDDEALAIAGNCATHLMAKRSESDSGFRCWKTFEGRPISGQAHGNSGIALALLRLGRILGAGEYREAALEAISFENSTFSEKHGNWPDLRWGTVSYATGWCHGAPGMALSRLEWLGDAAQDDFAARLRRDIEHSTRAARQSVGPGPYHICCGNFGRTLLLAELAETTGSQELAAAASQFASALVMRARQQGNYRFMRQYNGYVTFPGLFQGSSGICLALLRLGFRDLTPDVISLR